jgi:hypothetical protein
MTKEICWECFELYFFLKECNQCGFNYCLDCINKHLEKKACEICKLETELVKKKSTFVKHVFYVIFQIFVFNVELNQKIQCIIQEVIVNFVINVLFHR